MKYTLFLALILSFSHRDLLAQNEALPNPFPIEENKISYKEVVQVEDANAGSLYLAAIEFFKTKPNTFRRSNSRRPGTQGDDVWLGEGNTGDNAESVTALYRNEEPIKFEDEENHKIIVSVTNKYEGTAMGCLREMYLSYDITIEFKDNRYRYEISNFSYTHFNQMTMAQAGLYIMGGRGLCEAQNELEILLECSKCKNQLTKLYDYLHSDTLDLVKTIKDSIQGNLSSEEDDW